jgi:hypothetical protein
MLHTCKGSLPLLPRFDAGRQAYLGSGPNLVNDTFFLSPTFDTNNLLIPKIDIFIDFSSHKLMTPTFVLPPTVFEQKQIENPKTNH